MFRQWQLATAALTKTCSLQSLHIKVRQSEICLSWDWTVWVWAHTAHLCVLIGNFIVRPGVSGSTTGGCSPPTIGEEGKQDVIALVSGLDVTSGSPRCHSQEGMPHSVTDVSYGLHVHTVVMQRFWVCCRTRFCQEDAEPPAEILWAARLKGRNRKKVVVFLKLKSIFLV